MLRPNSLAWPLALALLVPSLTLALSSDKDQPIELTADSATLDQAKGETVYEGDVDMRQGSMRLQADRLVIRGQGSKPNQVIANGKVRFQQQSEDGKLVKGRSQHAQYQVDSDLLELTGDAFLTQGGDTLQSDRIVYDRSQHKVLAGTAASGKQRVQITIQPKQN